MSALDKILSTNPSPDDLIPISKTELLGLGVRRRVIGRRIAAGEFPTPIRINHRLYITVAQLAEYKQSLLRGEIVSSPDKKPGRPRLSKEERARRQAAAQLLRLGEQKLALDAREKKLREEEARLRRAAGLSEHSASAE